MHVDIWGSSFGSLKEPQVCLACTRQRTETIWHLRQIKSILPMHTLDGLT